MLLLDVGDSLVGDEDPAKRTQGASSIDIMNQMGYDAMAVGSTDLLLGRETVQQRQSEAQFQFLSANVVVTGTGALLFAPYIVKEIDGIKVGVLGITDPWEAGLDGVRVTDPFSATIRFVPEMREESDLVVVLSRAGRPVDQRIAAEVPGVDFIISGGPYDQTSQPITNSETGIVVVQADRAAKGHAGRYVGVFEMTLDPDRQLVSYDWLVKGMGPDIADDADMSELMHYWRQQAPGDD